MESVDGAAPAGASRAGVRAVLLVTGVAVVVAGALAAWARLAGRPADDDGPPPLAFGIEQGAAPPALPPEAEGQLVVAARTLEAVPPQSGGCGLEGGLGGAVRAERVVALPEAVLVLQEVGDPPRTRTCVLLQDFGSSASEHSGSTTGVLGSGCCTREGFAWTEAAVAVPDGAAWALQDRGGWFVAYPVVDDRVHVLWTHSSGGDPFANGARVATPFTFLDAAGEVVGRTQAGDGA